MAQDYSTRVAGFWARVDRSGDCWVWLRSTYSNGYGDCYWQGRKHNLTHRLSWEITFGPIPDGLLVLHKCDNPPCVRPSHLFLGTHKTNSDDMIAKGRAATGDEKRPKNPARGEAAGNAKLTALQVMEIQKLYASGEYSQEQLAVGYGVWQSTIAKLVNGERWQHLGGRVTEVNAEAVAKRRSAQVAGMNHGSAKLTDEQVIQIKSYLQSGRGTNASLAREFGVSGSAISMIRSGKRWSHLP